MALWTSENKLSGFMREDGFTLFHENHRATLHQGICIVEIDLVHERKSHIRQLPSYPIDKNSNPYIVVIFDVRAGVQEGWVSLYPFDISSDFPMIDIPLSNPDRICLNLQKVYSETYQLGRWGIHRDLVDYT